MSEDIFPMFFGTSKKSMDEIDYTLKPRRKKQSSSSRPPYHRTTYPQHPPVQMVRTRRNYHPKSSIPSAYPPPPYPVYRYLLVFR